MAPVDKIVLVSSPIEKARERARLLRRKGDFEGARAALEAALNESPGEVERATLQADLVSLKGELESFVTRETKAPTVARTLQRSAPDADGILGSAPAIVRLRKELARAASANVPLLIEGESGAGKELVARAIHRRSSRAAEPFLALSAATLATGVVEAELFGHVAGAFTGATTAREGLLVEAGKGTLLLDGIEEMPLDTQAKLLRVLETGEVRPVGGADVRKIEARLVATTRRALGPLVRAGKFREDLLYRLNVLTINVPPLRERPEDVPLLVEELLARHAAKPPRVTDAAMKLLQEYGWPGNVRELENELRRLLVVGCDPIDEASLAPAVRAGRAPERDLSTGMFERLRGRSLEEIERQAILAALRATDGNRSAAARILKVSRRALYDKLRRLGIEG